MADLRVGFVGAGFNAGFHARALGAVRGVQVAGVHALAGAEDYSAKACAMGLGQCSVYQSVADLCQAVDVVMISAPNFVRLEIMREVAENGQNLAGVICEKPLARNMAEANQMVELAAPFRTAYFENQIHMPGIQRAREALAATEAAMGPIHLARSAEEHGGPHEPWFWMAMKQGGGVWCDMGCHSAAVGWYMVTPFGKEPTFMLPVWVQGCMELRKWRLPSWREKLLARGVDYSESPAEDHAEVILGFMNPETGYNVSVHATDSWMFDNIGLRLSMEAMGPGWAYDGNTLNTSFRMFISDEAAQAVQDAERVLEKSQATRGSLPLMTNEPDEYGYCAEWRDALAAFNDGRDGLLDFKYGREVVRLVMAGYYSHEVANGARVKVADVPEDYIPLIQQGRGAEVLL